MAPLFMTYESVGWCKEGDSGTPGEDSNPNGVVSISGWYHEPWIKDIGTSEAHPPLIQLTWTQDTWTPYEKIPKAIHEQAQRVGMPSTLIVKEGDSHGNLDELMQEAYFGAMTRSLYKYVTNGAQAPDGCVL